MEALLLNEYHAQEVETKKRIYREAWKAFTAYHMITNNMEEEEVETKKRALQIMKGNKKLQSQLEEDTWKAFTAYQRKQNIKLKNEQKRAKKRTDKEGPSR